MSLYLSEAITNQSESINETANGWQLSRISKDIKNLHIKIISYNTLENVNIS